MMSELDPSGFIAPSEQMLNHHPSNLGVRFAVRTAGWSDELFSQQVGIAAIHRELHSEMKKLNKLARSAKGRRLPAEQMAIVSSQKQMIGSELINTNSQLLLELQGDH